MKIEVFTNIPGAGYTGDYRQCLLMDETGEAAREERKGDLHLMLSPWSPPSFMKLCHEIVGDLRHGMQAMYDWNLVLDEHGEPNYVGNFAHAPFLFDTGSHTLMPQETLRYFYQLSHYIPSGAVRIESTSFSDQVVTVAYRTPAGKIVLIVLNKNSEAVPITVRMQGKGAQFLIPAATIVSCIIEDCPLAAVKK